MSARNNVSLVGRLVQNNELQEVNGGDNKVLRNRLAVDRNYKNSDGERDTDFINIVAWNGLAETIAQYTEKGCRVSINGEIRTSSREVDGQTYYNVDVRVDDLGIIDFAEDTEGSNQNSSSKNQSNEDDTQGDVEDVDEVLDDMEEEFDVPF